MVKILWVFCGILWTCAAGAQTPVSPLSSDFQALLDAPLPPLSRSNPQGTQLLWLERAPTLPMTYLATPSIGLAGVEIDTALGAPKRRRYLSRPTLFDLATQESRAISLPAERNINAFEFSPDGRNLALLIDASDGVELWLVDSSSGRSRHVRNLWVNEIFSNALSWSNDSQKLYVATRVGDAVPSSILRDTPSVEEANGTKVPARTYAHLLRSPSDVSLFERYAKIQWKEVNVRDLSRRAIGAPGFYTSLEPAPKADMLLVKRLIPPFSYAVPASLFAHQVEVWDSKGKVLRQVLTMPLADEVPPEGERRGPRNVRWQLDYPARLIWFEALDEGDPRKKVPHRDRVMSWDAPFAGEAKGQEIARSVDRISSLQFLQEKDQFLLRSFNPDSNLATLSFFRGVTAEAPLRTLLSYDVKDDYNDPGRLVTINDAQGSVRVAREGDDLFLAGDGKNPKGERPFIDRLNLNTLAKDRIFQSEGGDAWLEEFAFFYRNTSDAIVLSREARSSPPNLWLWQRSGAKATKIPLTQFVDAVPTMTRSERRPLVFKRKDGLTMSGTLYLPAQFKSGEKLPAVVWAYPEEYRSAAVAGQVRASTQRYARPGPTGIEWLVTQGYAVLDNAAMPLIGDKETVNNTLVAQLVSNAEAVVEALDATGQIDRQRIAVGGHSYGAFMTANLLAHSQLFCAGIARSGAYNRTLTPFGFQSERRTFWEAKDFYMNVSPFYHVESFKTPLLLVHGKDDNNPGTTPIQTERMFHALRGVGAKARMVLLPYESHSYRGHDNVSLLQAETLSWLRRWCTGA